jgi:hypothetical protein
LLTTGHSAAFGSFFSRMRVHHALALLSALVAFDCVVGLSRPLDPREQATLSPSGWIKTCPKCGRAPGGSPNCCSPGGSWFGKCSVKTSKGGAPTFPEGFEACNDQTEIRKKQEHEAVVFTAVREKDLAEQKVTDDVDALIAATKLDAEAEADRRVAAAKLEAEAEADRRVEAVKRDTEATAERRVAKEAARAVKAEEEKAKIEANVNETKVALEAKYDLAKAEADAKEAKEAREAAEAKEAEREQKLKEYKEAVEAEKARKAEAEAKEVADKALKVETEKKKAIADTVMLEAAQKASMEAARRVREAEEAEAAAAEDMRDQKEAEALRADAAEAEKRAALKEAEAVKLEEENDIVTMYAASEEKDPADGAPANVGSGAAAPSADAAAEARAALASEKEQADAIQAAMEWQSRETVVPRDGVCEDSELSSALRSVVVTTKDGTCADSRKWKMLDPSVNLKMFDDKAAENLVRENYPDLLTTYQGLAHGVERADLFRYLAIHLDGGIYADCDVEPNACVSKWLKEYEWFEGREGLRINSSVPLLVVGVEFDAEGGWVLESILNNGTAKSNGTSRIQLCQWIFAATAPRHPALVSVMGEVQARVASFPDNTNLITDRTGPVAWTAGVMRYIRRYNVSGEDLMPVRKLDHHGQLFQMREPSGVESQVLLLPYRAFAYPGAHGPGVFEEPARQKLVHHMFKGSWKPSLRHKVTDLMGLADSQSKKGHKI